MRQRVISKEIDQLLVSHGLVRTPLVADESLAYYQGRDLCALLPLRADLPRGRVFSGKGEGTWFRVSSSFELEVALILETLLP